MTIVSIKYPGSTKKYEYEVDIFEITGISEEKVEDSTDKEVISARERNTLRKGQIITNFEFMELFAPIAVFDLTKAFKKKPKIKDKIILFYTKSKVPVWKIPNLDFGNSLAKALSEV